MSLNLNKLLTAWIVIVLGVIIFTSTPTSACSCMPTHPQAQYCQSSYVILAKVIKKVDPNPEDEYGNITYKIDMKKYKMSEKAKYFLKGGKITTSKSSATCGVDLQVGKYYVIAASSAHIGLCNYVKSYSDMTITERRGMAREYKRGCQCQIHLMSGNRMRAGACNWNFSGDFCELDYGVCIPRPSQMKKNQVKCHWRTALPYNKCKLNSLQNNMP